jgi:hypothetical protein
MITSHGKAHKNNVTLLHLRLYQQQCFFSSSNGAVESFPLDFKQAVQIM